MKLGKLVTGLAFAILFAGCAAEHDSGRQQTGLAQSDVSRYVAAMSEQPGQLAQASLRARTFLDSSRGLEHGKRVRAVPSSVAQRRHPRRPRQIGGCMNKCELRLNMEALVQELLAVPAHAKASKGEHHGFLAHRRPFQLSRDPRASESSNNRFRRPSG